MGDNRSFQVARRLVTRSAPVRKQQPSAKPQRQVTPAFGMGRNRLGPRLF